MGAQARVAGASMIEPRAAPLMRARSAARWCVAVGGRDAAPARHGRRSDVGRRLHVKPRVRAVGGTVGATGNDVTEFHVKRAWAVTGAGGLCR